MITIFLTRSLRARYICIVAVQHRHSGKIDLQVFSKLMAVEKSVFTSSQCPFAIQLINSINSITACLLLSNLNRICKLKWLLLGAGGTHPLLRTLLCPQPHLNQWILMNAYRDGKGTKEARIQVKKFSSHKRPSHHWVYESRVWLDIPYIVIIDAQDKPYRVTANLVISRNL